MPTVTEMELFAVDLPFRIVFRHAAATRLTSESLFLRMRLDDGAEGWGECLPRAYVSGERRDETFALLRDAILPGLLGREFADLRDVTTFLEKCDGKAPTDWVAPDVPQTAASSSSLSFTCRNPYARNTSSDLTAGQPRPADATPLYGVADVGPGHTGLLGHAMGAVRS